MPAVSLASLAVVLAAAFLVRLALGAVPRLRLPGVVVEILLGIVIGPAVLGLARPDGPVTLVAVLGMAFVLFLSGLEIDVALLRGAVGRRAGFGFVASVVLAVSIGHGLAAIGVTTNPLLVAVALTATSVGLVAPVLAEASVAASVAGRLVLAGSSSADLGAIVALSLLFSRDTRDRSTRIVLLVVFVLAVVVLAWGASRSARSAVLSRVLLRLQDTSAQIRVRAVVALLVGLVALAQRTGIETILAAFVAGALVSTIDRDAMQTHPQLRLKLDAIGHGFLVPVFFVTSGMRFDLHALGHAGVLARVPLFLGALLAVRGLPALAYRGLLAPRALVAAGLLQATSLPSLVTASTIGVEIGALSRGNAAALVAAGLVSSLAFPSLALVLLGDAGTAGVEPEDSLPPAVTDAGGRDTTRS